MTGPKFRRVRVPQFTQIEHHGPQWRDDAAIPLLKAPSPRNVLRHDFANLVVRKLAVPEARLAVIDEGGKPAVVSCSERLYDLLSKDHPIVGVYTAGARVRDIIEDLKASGL